MPFPEFIRLLSFLSLGPDVADHSLSAVAGELVGSSVLVLFEVDSETEELALISLSFPSSSLKIRERAILYAASRSSMVILFLELPPVALLRPPWLPDSEGSKSERSASSPAIEPV